MTRTTNTVAAPSSASPDPTAGNSTGAAAAQVYRMSTVVRILGLSKATIYRRIKDGDLVKVTLGPRATGITAESVRQFVSTDKIG